jgi:spermidine dehydrogenase
MAERPDRAEETPDRANNGEMTAQDRALGMDCAITRRDFLGNTAKILGGAVVASATGFASEPSAAPTATPPTVAPGAYYPPLLNGMRGFEDAAMNMGHAVRDGQAFGPPADTGEAYDLVVVGSGMAGLSAAYFYRQQVPGAKILVLDGCDDFGGHARRVEFNVDGRQLLVCGGTEELWNVNTFSPESLQMLKDIGIDRERYAQYVKADKDPLEALDQGVAGFFDQETFGADRLVPKRPAMQGVTAAQLQAWYDQTPMSVNLKAGLIKLYTDQTDYLAGLPVGEKIARLRKMTYLEYLANVAQIHPEAVAYILRSGSGDTDNSSAGPDTYSAWSAWLRNRRGFAGLGLPRNTRTASLVKEVGQNIAFPDGNAGVARLLIRSLIPGALPGKTAEDSIGTPVRYDQLDLPANDVRIRLSSMVVRVAHLGDPASASGVEAVYLHDGKLCRVRAGSAVMACFNVIIPHLVPELPEAQKAALRLAVRKPLVRTFVAIRNWTAFQKLGIYEVDCPGMFFRYLRPWIMPEWGGAYRNAQTPEDPVVVYLNMANPPLEMHGTDAPPRDRWRGARAQLQALSLETIERNARSQLNRILGPGGFDARRDIAGITVCRWSHGYAGGTNELYDPDWSHRPDAPWVVGRQRFGRIAISNSDAAATSLTSAAFAQSHRAVMELVNDIVRPVYDFRWSERDTSVEPPIS